MGSIRRGLGRGAMMAALAASTIAGAGAAAVAPEAGVRPPPGMDLMRDPGWGRRAVGKQNFTKRGPRQQFRYHDSRDFYGKHREGALEKAYANRGGADRK